MQLEDIDEEKEKHWGKSSGPRKQSQAREPRGRSESVESTKPEARRGSNLLAAAGIDFERRRKQLHSQVSATAPNNETRIFQEGDQWMEEKDGKVTKLELVEVKERMGKMRRAVPTLPLPAACVLCILNFVLPSIGTFIGVGTLVCGAKCRHEKTTDGIKYGILAGILQLLLTPILVGWIFSIYYGANIVQDSLTKGGSQQQQERNGEQDEVIVNARTGEAVASDTNIP